MKDGNITVLDEKLALERDYWLQKLSEASAPASFPLDFPRSAGAAGKDRLEIAIDPAISRRLVQVCGGRDSLLLAALLTATKILLHRYTGLQDVIVGTTVHRQHGEVTALNRLLAVRDPIDPETTGRKLLLAVKESLAEAYEHQKLPFQRLVELLGIERQRDQPALFSVLVLLENINLRAHADEAVTDIVLIFRRSGEEVAGTLEFEKGLFYRQTAEILVRHLLAVLRGMLAEPDLAVADLRLLDVESEQRLLRELTPPASCFPRDQAIHRLFEEQVRRTPGAEALVLGGSSLTYRDLNEQANRLAAYLARSGVRSGDRVALCLEHSFDVVVSVLAVLKAGAAYVPLDPDYPKARLDYMVADSGARLVLTQEALAGRVEGHRSVLLLERHRDAVESESSLDRPVDPDEAGRLAYVIYTSGSTGAPKGVQIRHSSLVSYVWWAREVYLRGESFDFPLYTSLSFDLTVTSLYTPLITGNRLILYPGRESEYPLLDLVRDDRVGVVKLTPSHLELIKDRDNSRSRIRRLIVGGEALPTATARQVLDSFGGRVEIYNEYGPTEATVGCMLHRYDPAADRRGFVPIGLPAANVRLYVLDEALRPVAENMLGELYIAGDCLAEGYLNQQGLTAERFVPDPFAPGHRLYRSGDLVRRLPEGILDFVGRSDEQVKIRGYRIELSEIRGALNSHPAVRASVVTVVREPAGPVLVAYYVARKEIDEGELRTFLASSLLEEAVPAFFVHLRRLPLTLNGKVNIKALPTLAEVRKRARPGYVAPRTDAERVMAGIWASVLGLGQVGIHDNFFHLGGDSIVGIRVVAKANQAGFRLVPRQLFQHQTVAELAAVAAEAAPAPAAEEGPAGPMPLTPIQRAFFESVEIEPWHYNQAVLLELQGRASRRPELLRAALARLLDRHDALRLRYVRQADGWHQVGHAAGEPPALVWIDLSGLGEEARRDGFAAAAAALQASLDLERGPLARFTVFDCGTGEATRLLAVIHHLAVDGVSWRILMEELDGSLAALAAGEPVRLPPPTSSFRTWATRIAEQVRSGAFDSELPYWLSLAEVSVPPLPVDFPDGVNDVASVREVSVSLTEEETRALLQEVPRAYRTRIDEVLLTALVESLGTWTGRRRLLVALEGHGREEVAPGLDLSRTVGWFTSVFPVLLDAEGLQGPGAALKKVKESLRAIPNRGAGYGLLRHLGERTEGLRRLPEPELSFNYLGRFDDVFAGASSLRPAQGEIGPVRSPRQRRLHLLEIDGLVAGGRLGLRWTFSGNLHRVETIERLAAAFAGQLRALIAHCTAPGVGGWTPSDFPLARVDQVLLDRLASGRELEDLYPLSPLQQGLLFHSLDRWGSDTYFRQLTCTLRGPLDTAAFLRASQEVLDRHPVLRTGFIWEGAPEPLQQVVARAVLPVEERDWRSLDSREREERCRAFREADRERGFDLSDPPLLRLALLRLEDEVHQLVWSFHHLISDGWSFPLVVAETFGLYEAFRRGEEPRRETPRPFRDYIAWLLGQDLAAAERFWRRELAGFTAPTPLALDREPRGAEAGALQADERSFLLPARVTGALQEWSRRHHLTLNTVVQGAWALLLARYAGARDVVFGAVSSGRSAALAGIESMLGVFINTLPVRVTLQDREPLLAWLRGLQERQSEAREYEYSPLAQVQTWSEVPRGQALFQSLMAFENYPVEAAVGQQGFGGLRVTGIDFPESTNYPLTLMMAPGPRLPIRLIYDRRRFDPSTIARRLRHFEALLEAFADQPQTAVADLPMLGAAERHQLLAEWNDSRRTPLRTELIHQLFESRAKIRPEAAAVLFEGGCWSYAELNERANRLAHLLRSLGVAAGDLVAVHLSRSPAMVEAVLGILKAGAAYVPLDADYPRARIEWILGAQGIRCLVTETARLEMAASVGHVICLDAESADLAAQPAKNPPPVAGPEDIAYIIFTSGSTGAPKGVVLRHAPVVNLIDWVNRTFEIGERDRVLFITSLCFDLSVYDIFGLLAAGGSIRIAAKEQVRDPEELLRLLREEPITFWDSAPAALQQVAPYLTAQANGRSGGSLRLVFLSGDWIPVALPDQLREAFPGARVVGLGGATEAAIWSNFFPVDGSVADRVSVPYGRPIQNARYHVLDERLEPCPVGVAGDLYIAGDCLASGYAGAPELTAERFVADPFADAVGTRFYWTGDRARYLPDGNLEFLGRRDHQVKIRGFRIELGEIEAALAQHPGIADAVAMVREDQPSHRRLVAYFVPREEPGPGRAELREHLSERLPDYMVPAAFVAIPRLPLTSNGKLDRRALPVPEDAAVPDAGAGMAPRNDVEERLARVWSEVLGVERVGVTDNFFELGGDSILSIQVVSRAGQAGVRIAPNQLFEHPTIAELAAVAVPGVTAAEPQERETGEVPLSPAQRWFFEAEPEEPQHFNQALLLQVRGGLDPGVLEQALARLLEHHDALRLRFRTEDGWVQSHAEGDPQVPLLVLDLSEMPPGETAAAVEQAAARVQASLDLAGPLFRAAVFHLGDGRPDRLLLVIHHLLVDGVSWRILLEDLAEIYRALSSGAEPALMPKTASFRRWAELLQRHARSAAMEEELDYWTTPERRAVARLPVDFERGPDTVGSARAVTVSLDRGETRSLLEEAPGAFRSQVLDLLLSAAAAALSRWTGSPLQLVEIEGHGREPLTEETDLSRTVGWFTTFTPVLLDLRSAGGPVEVLRRVKEQMRGVPRRGLGYGLLRYLAGPETGARLRALPQAEVSFNYLGRLDQVLAEGSLFSLAPESAGPAEAPVQRRRYRLMVNAAVLHGELGVTWVYSENLHRRETVEALAADFAATLRSLLRSQDARALALAPSDFPLARLDAAALERISAVPDLRIEDIYPLAPLQEGLLFHALEGRSGQDLYFEQLTCRLVGELRFDAFRSAWSRVAARHPILRTAFLLEGVPEPLQVVDGRAEPEWELGDWSALAEPERSLRLRDFLESDRAAGFDLSRAPLMRFALFRLGPADHRFVWSFHHLLLDGWSLALVLQDLFALYKEEDRPAPRPYREYVAWVRQQDLGAAEAFWKGALKGFAAPTPLPSDRRAAAPGRGRQDAGETSVRLSLTASERLGQLARRHQVTPNTLVTGAWALLLARWSAEPEVLFGVVSSGRPASLPDAERMVGLFINTLPLRVAVPPRDRLPEWLRRLQATQLEARQYEHSPLSSVTAWSEIGPGQPLFESLVIYENFPVSRGVEQGQGSGFEVWEVGFHEASNYPITLLAVPDASIRLTALYDGQRFDPSTACRLLQQLEVLLEGMAGSPMADLASLPLLTSAARHQIVCEWGQGAEGSAGDFGLHQLFARQAARTPEAVALIWRDQRITYADLERRIGRLVLRLRGESVGPEAAVGIHLGRTPGLVVALLAVLEAGGFYVPLDPTLPSERLGFLLRDSGARVLLNGEGLASPPDAEGVRTLVLSDGGEVDEVAELAPVAVPEEGGTGGHLAYLIYTSGSTGRPKGVAIEHRSAMALVHWAQRVFPAEDLACVLASTSISFDLSVFEIFVTLASGGTVVLVDHALMPPPPDAGVRLINTVPSALGELLDSGALPPTVTTVNLAGEALTLPLAERILRHLGVQRLYNLYGPTEDTTYSTWARITSGDGAPPIGRPIDSTRALVLDGDMRPLPPGVVGELHLGGHGLARGYFGRPDLTAASFIPDPFSSDPGARLYRTGDLVRWRGDGRLEYLGRRDHQIKLRGFRIECGEIEATLSSHPEVARAAVLAVSAQGESRLVAFLVPRPGAGPSSGELRSFLLGKLPAYMVPASFVTLPELPLNANGKVDRRALAATASLTGAKTHPYVAPESELERLLADLWREELHVDRVGRYDNFFELGGHSLVMLRLFGKIKERFTSSLLMVELFEYPTVSAMAQRLALERSAPPVALDELGQSRAEARLQARRRRASRPEAPEMG